MLDNLVIRPFKAADWSVLGQLESIKNQFRSRQQLLEWYRQRRLIDAGYRLWLACTDSVGPSCLLLGCHHPVDSETTLRVQIVGGQTDTGMPGLLSSLLQHFWLAHPVYRQEWLFLKQDDRIDRNQENDPDRIADWVQAFAPYPHESVELSGYWNLANQVSPASALMISVLRPQRLDENIAFVPFKMGALAIKGNQQRVRSIHFLHAGELVGDQQIAWAADSLYYLDNQGRLHKSAALVDDEREGLPTALIEAVRQCREYFTGQRETFDLPLDLGQGSPFQRGVWQAISRIPYGNTVTYEELASGLLTEGQQAHQLARAVGSACGANPLPVVIPCHRVIGKNGRLTGFTGGLDIKEYLLNHELLGI